MQKTAGLIDEQYAVRVAVVTAHLAQIKRAAARTGHDVIGHVTVRGRRAARLAHRVRRVETARVAGSHVTPRRRRRRRPAAREVQLDAVARPVTWSVGVPSNAPLTT